VDDRASAGLQHFRQKAADHDVVAAHIQIEREIPILVRTLQDGAVMDEPRTIENDVWRAHFGSHLCNVSVLEHVEFAYFNTRGAFEFGQFCIVEVGRPHSGAFAGKRQRSCAANTLCCGSHESNLAAQSSSHALPLLCVNPVQDGKYATGALCFLSRSCCCAAVSLRLNRIPVKSERGMALDLKTLLRAHQTRRTLSSAGLQVPG